MLTSGHTLGPYRILEKIGEGGMGEVYRAHDTQLGRDVALKVLPEAWADDADRMTRFRREAQLLASLNHPRIAQIYGVESKALVMELVEGPTLADRIARCPLPVDEAVAIARQIVDALDAAHENGIIHRDLKPANVKIREDGTVKLLDFGLAKAVAPDARQSASTPTVTSPAMTAMGIIIGTAAYMSPEQARGRTVDKRTDVWAFGCVLFEMLAGRRPFDGEDVTEVLAAVVKSEPAWDLLPASVPHPLVTLLRRCLEKDVRLRLRDIGDARFDLSEQPRTNVSHLARSAPSRRERLGWFAAVVVCAAFAAVAWWPRSAPAGSAAVATHFSYVLPDGQRPYAGLRHLAISPDGRVIVSATSSRLYRRAVNEFEPQPIPGTENATFPFFSPDGRSIAYLGFDAVGKDVVVKAVPITGGIPVTVADLGDVSNKEGWSPLDVGASWHGSDIIMSNAAGISAVSATTGARRVLVPLDPAAEVGTAAQLVDDGRQVLFTLRRANDTSPDASSIVVQGVGGRPARRVLARAATMGVALPSGHLVFLRGTDLMAAPFDTRRLEVTGDPSVIATGVTMQWAIANGGTIAYETPTAASARSFVWVDRHGNEEPIAIPLQGAALLRLSRDGRRLALTSDTEIRVWSFEKSTITRIAEPGGRHYDAVWRTDGRRLLFSGGPSMTAMRILEKTVDGAGVATVLAEAPDGGFPNAISPDDRFLIFHRGAGELMLLPLARPAQPRRLVPGIALNAVFSPDGRWIAYQSHETGRPEIVVRAFPNTEARKWQVSSGGGKFPLWSPDGKELFFISGAGALTSVAVDSRDGFATGTPVELFQTRPYTLTAYSRPFDISRDGKRFVFIKSMADAKPTINVVTNWSAETAR